MARILLFICIGIFAIPMQISCKKETATPSLYTVDSIQVFIDGAYTYTIQRNELSWPDLTNDTVYDGVALNSFNNKSQTGDTVSFRRDDQYPPNPPGGISYVSLRLMLAGDLPLYSYYKTNIIGGIGQDGSDEHEIFYRYELGRISSLSYVNFRLLSAFGGSGDEYKTDSFAYAYTGNTLSAISKYKDYGPGPEVMHAAFSYPSGLSNQTELIGIDVNELILDASLNAAVTVPIGVFYGLSPSPIIAFAISPGMVILSGFPSFTKSDKLIENIEVTLYPSAAITVTPIYTFDPLFNNRITELSVPDLSSGIRTFKFFYRP